MDSHIPATDAVPGIGDQWREDPHHAGQSGVYQVGQKRKGLAQVDFDAQQRGCPLILRSPDWGIQFRVCAGHDVESGPTNKKAGKVENEDMQHYRGGKSPSALGRPLGPTESIYYLLDQLYCLSFVVFAKMDHALRTVQQEKPLLRARIALVKGQPAF